MENLKMVEVTRSGEIESFHQGVAVLINSSGNILKEWGNTDLNIYPRSALKPIQTLNLYKKFLQRKFRHNLFLLIYHRHQCNKSEQKDFLKLI